MPPSKSNRVCRVPVRAVNAVRRDEQFAKEAFSRFIGARDATPAQWETGSQPPDFWLVLGRRRFAVEVTQLMDVFNVGPVRMTARGAHASLDHAVKQLRAEAESTGLLRGFYHIDVCPLPGLRDVLPEIQARLVDYLSETATVPAAGRRELWRGRRGRRWTVEKYHAESDALAESMSLGEARWEGEVREELRRLLSEALAKKLEKSRPIAEDVVLLLVDAYHYADTETWLRVAGAVGMSGFHTVARVHSDHECQVLSTAEPGWSASARLPELSP